jgi:CO dehydrogenase nickel-insertion accessory protein CooC1
MGSSLLASSENESESLTLQSKIKQLRTIRESLLAADSEAGLEELKRRIEELEIEPIVTNTCGDNA